MRLLIRLLLLVAVAGGAGASYGLDAALAKVAKSDPLGRTDAFASLKPGLKRLLSNPRPEVGAKLEAVLSLACTTQVTVKLVGFSGDERSQLETQLSRYLEVLNKEDRVHLTGGTNNHELSVRSKLQVDVVSGSKSLADTISGAIESHLAQQSGSSLSSIYHQPVPYTVVDQIVQADLPPRPLSSYVIYLLNLRPQSRSYGYDYKPPPSSSGDATLSAFTKCLGNYWTARERYMWIDLAAGPIEYGPALSGEGLVVREETYPAAAAALSASQPRQKAVLADLASLVWSASQMLLSPAIRVPVVYTQHILVQLYHVMDMQQERQPDKGDAIDWNAVESGLRDSELLLPGQKLRFQRLSIDLATCAVCSAMLAQSTRTYTSRVLLDSYSLFVNEYLDSKQLHHLLSSSATELQRLAGAPVEEEEQLVVPVYVFDLDAERVVMLDRSHQAVAFRDMVIAVRSRGFQTLSEFTCNGRSVVLQTREVERPLVASLLQVVWGVAPSHLTWSQAHNSTLLDYTWSLGQTPFGPFSELSSLSFVQVDAARRNVLLLLLNSTVWGTIHVLEAVRDMGGDGHLPMSGATRTEAAQRWNLLLYKLRKATSALSYFDFDMAFFLVRSAEHDLYKLHVLVYGASSALEAVIVCFKQPPLPWAWILLATGSLLLLAVLFSRRKHLLMSKRKRF